MGSWRKDHQPEPLGQVQWPAQTALTVLSIGNVLSLGSTSLAARYGCPSRFTETSGSDITAVLGSNAVLRPSLGSDVACRAIAASTLRLVSLKVVTVGVG